MGYSSEDYNQFQMKEETHRIGKKTKWASITSKPSIR